MNSEVARIIRYIMVGGLSALTHFAVAWMIINTWGEGVLIAAASGYAAGFIVSVWGHRSFTFVSDIQLSVVVQKMIGVAALGTIYNAVLSAGLTSRGIDPEIAIITGIVTTPMLNYIVMKFWVFSS